MVTGNTAIDAMKTTIKDNYQSEIIERHSDKKIILLTAHRRENIGTPMHNILKQFKSLLMNMKISLLFIQCIKILK